MRKIEYNVSVDNREFTVNVEKTQKSNYSESDQNKINVESAKICYDTAKAEYDYIINKDIKLDNKIYILFTVCGFTFAFIMGLIANIGDFEFCKTISKNILLIGYIIVCVIMIFLFFLTIL